jgi:hypothetical protein
MIGVSTCGITFSLLHDRGDNPEKNEQRKEKGVANRKDQTVARLQSCGPRKSAHHPNTPISMKPRSFVLLLAFLSLAAKLYCAATTLGTSDVGIFSIFARSIHEGGLIEMYKSTQYFNHTPFVGWFLEAIHALSGGNVWVFAFLLRLPAIFADMGAVLTLLWLRDKTGRPAWWALALFAASPVAFMVSGYHGNVDSVMAMFVLMAAAACTTERAILCGLAFGLSCNVKIVPLLLAPAFVFFWWKRGHLVQFGAASALCILAGWSLPLLTIPAVFLKDVLGYGSVWGVWGIPYFLRMSGIAAFGGIAMFEPTRAQSAVMLALKVIIIPSVIVIAWRRRGMESIKIFQTLALVWAVFFVFAPGFGAQYLVWLAPCFLVASESWYAALTLCSSVALFIFYNAISNGMPWMMGFNLLSTASLWTRWLVLPWAVLVCFLIHQTRAARALDNHIAQIPADLLADSSPINR